MRGPQPLEISALDSITGLRPGAPVGLAQDLGPLLLAETTCLRDFTSSQEPSSRASGGSRSRGQSKAIQIPFESFGSNPGVGPWEAEVEVATAVSHAPASNTTRHPMSPCNGLLGGGASRNGQALARSCRSVEGFKVDVRVALVCELSLVAKAFRGGIEQSVSAEVLNNV